MENNKITITNEEEAWEWFRKAIEKVDIDEHTEIEFKGWPNLEITISGRDFRGTMPTRIMPAIMDLQKEIHRVYCLLKYGEDNTRKLTLEDRERIELVVAIEKGSSLFNVELGKQLNEAFISAISRMESRHLAITVIGVALTIAAPVAWKDYLDSQAKQNEIESRVTMSQLEKEKLSLFASGAKEAPEIAIAQRGADEFRNHSLHRLKENDVLSIQGTDIEVDGAHAADITHKPREQSIEVRIDGEFLIQSVDSGNVTGYRIKAKRIIDGTVITVTLPDTLISHDQKEILKNAEWAKEPVLMEINAKELRGKITSATLVSVQKIEPQQES